MSEVAPWKFNSTAGRLFLDPIFHVRNKQFEISESIDVGTPASEAEYMRKRELINELNDEALVRELRPDISLNGIVPESLKTGYYSPETDWRNHTEEHLEQKRKRLKEILEESRQQRVEGDSPSANSVDPWERGYGFEYAEAFYRAEAVAKKLLDWAIEDLDDWQVQLVPKADEN